MTNKYIEKIKQAYKDGVINEYMVRRLIGAMDKGFTDSLSEEIIQDAQYASDVGVRSDKDYNVYFFIVRLADDILNDTFGLKVSQEDKKDLCHFMMANRNENKDYKLDNLTDHRLLIHKWLCNRLSKKAYPNIAGKENRDPIQDIDKWVETLKNIYTSLHSKKLSRAAAIDYFTTDWDLDEKHKFVSWMRYYEDETTEKYNVKTANLTREAFMPEFSLPQAWINREDRASDGMNLSTTKREQTKKEKELEKAKQYKVQMKGRLRSFKKLLERYNDALPKQDLDKVYEELHGLEKSITKLDVFASIQDCIIRSANKIQKFGFHEGAEFLHKVAVEPEVIGSLPQPGSKEPDLPPQGAQMANVQGSINRLESISKELKSRNMIRELASIDILLNEMGLASYFPELTDAQAKLIESFGYASNKVESIIAKLRGSGKAQSKVVAPPVTPAPMPKMPEIPPALPAPAKPIETGEIMNKPVAEVQRKLPTG